MIPVQELVWVVSAFVFAGGVIWGVFRGRGRPDVVDSDPADRTVHRDQEYGSDLAFVGFSLAAFVAVYIVRAWGSWDWSVPMIALVGLAGARLADVLLSAKAAQWVPWVFVAVAAGLLAI